MFISTLRFSKIISVIKNFQSNLSDFFLEKFIFISFIQVKIILQFSCFISLFKEKILSKLEFRFFIFSKKIFSHKFSSFSKS